MSLTFLTSGEKSLVFVRRRTVSVWCSDRFAQYSSLVGTVFKGAPRKIADVKLLLFF